MKQLTHHSLPAPAFTPSARRLALHALSVLLLAILLSSSVACAKRTAYHQREFETFDTFVEALETVATSGTRAERNAFWNALVASEQVPFVRGDQVALLYRGRARSVQWVGDFTDWQNGPALEGRQIGRSDIWVAYATFPSDARLEYRIIINGREAAPDAANPLQQWGGFGPNSVIAMPDYVFPQEVLPREGVPQGGLSEPIALDSAQLGYTVNYQVYTPARYDALDSLPVIYVTDAHEYTDPRMGSMPTVLDNLIADGVIEPILAVFIDPRDPDTGENRRVSEFLGNLNYASFVAEELVPSIDGAYRTDATPDRRAILGVSYGGVNAAYCALIHSKVFHLVAMQSPAFMDDAIYRGYESADRLPLRFFLSAGYPWDLDARTIKDVLEHKGYPLEYVQAPEGHSWGQWRSQLDDLLIHFFASE